MTTDNLKGHHSLILLYDPKSEMHPAACPEWCPNRDDIYIIDEILCKKLLEKLRFTNLDQPSLSNAADDKILLTEYGSDAVLPGEISKAVKRVHPQKKKIGVAVGRMINAMVTASKSPAQCLRVEKHFLKKYITACRKGLAKNFNTAVIAFDKDEKHMIYLFHKLGELDKKNLDNLHPECDKIEVMEMTNPDCQLHVIDHFITLPTSDEILAKQGMRATYLEASAATGCVWVRHNPFETDCPMYLSQIEESTLHELDASNKLVSLFLLTSGEKDEKDGRVGILREHISKGICTQLHFVPNFMCLHELHINEIKRTPSPVQVSLQAAEKAGSIRIISTQLPSTSDSKANVRDSQVSVFPHKELLPDHRNPHTPASVFIQDQLRDLGGVDSLPQSAAFVQVLVKSEGASTSNAPTQHTNAASIEREKVRVVYWISSINADFLPCAECLASRTKVLLLSARRPYAWIVDGTRPEDILQCTMCLNMRIGAAIDMNFISVEGISSEKISQMFYVNPHPPPRDFESNPNPTFLKREPKEEPMSMKREPKEEPVSQDPTPPHKKSRGSGSNPSPFRHVKEEPT
uniref:AlNc14C307G10452 protein n=1 Tax=Albugo laibachii Nc14 TaxID=890382 RepID=F0WW03_9STRA|nr:AlNc14C307G10452 [Albugo laibachii Nc14]|eukprot:CCA25605.1 AlNc14C307G10452 [Albugo laibachii Nc14]